MKKLLALLLAMICCVSVIFLVACEPSDDIIDDGTLGEVGEEIYDEATQIVYSLNEDRRSYSVVKLSKEAENVVIPDTFNGLPVTNINGLWFPIEGPSPYTKLKSVVIGNNVTTIGQAAFRYCKTLESVTIPDSVTTIGNAAFCDCPNFKNLTLGNGVMVVETIAFGGCESLFTTYDNAKYLGNDDNPYMILIDTTSNAITSCQIHPSTKVIADQAFMDCRQLTELDIPEGVISVGYNQFDCCNNLQRVTIPKTVSYLGRTLFSFCYNLESVQVAKGNPSYYSANNGIIETATKTLVAACNTTVIPADGSVTQIGYGVFNYRDDITNISIPDTITSIGDMAFYGCDGLTSLSIPDSVTYIGSRAFAYCENLRSITLPNGITTLADSVFSGCISLTDITIPDSVTSIDAHVFERCKALKSLTIPNSVVSIGSFVFSQCDFLTNITYNGTIEQWKAIEKSDYWLSSLTKLQSVVCNDGTYSLK